MILVPYTALFAETVAAVPEARFVEITHEHHYRQLLGEMWSVGETFTLVEHDVAPTREQLATLDACPEPWCHFGYVPGDWVPTFGCVRFRKELIAGTQGVWDDPSWGWQALDAKFHVRARELGWQPHWHYPHVLHLRVLYRDEQGERRMRLTMEQEVYILEAEREMLRQEIGAR